MIIMQQCFLFSGAQGAPNKSFFPCDFFNAWFKILAPKKGSRRLCVFLFKVLFGPKLDTFTKYKRLFHPWRLFSGSEY